MAHLEGTMTTQRQIQHLRDGLRLQSGRPDAYLPVVAPAQPASWVGRTEFPPRTRFRASEGSLSRSGAARHGPGNASSHVVIQSDPTA